MISMLQRSKIVRVVGCFSVVAMLLGGFGPMPASQPAQAAQDEVLIQGFPSVEQWYNLDCEYAAAASVTLYWGNVVSQRDFIREVPSSPNPHLGFRGDINGGFGGINDYGVYAEALAPVLERHGYNAVTFYGGVSRLKSYMAAGDPVVVWITVGKNVERPVYRKSYNGETFKLVPGEHTLVVYGYDDGGVHVMDVGDGGFYYTDWDSFLRRWSYFDQMALAIYP